MKLFALLLLCAACLTTAYAQVDRTLSVWDTATVLPPGWAEQENPYNILFSMNCWTNPALDHTGKPHKHGSAVQLIADGGNRIQDPPNADGSPGGDDSLAFGNFNVVCVLGLSGFPDLEGRTGMFASQKFFVPQVPPGRGYYMRFWEGPNPAKALYYNDTIEYATSDDRGGAMIMLRPGLPDDVDWTFGPAKPRPGSANQVEKPKKSGKK